MKDLFYKFVGTITIVAIMISMFPQRTFAAVAMENKIEKAISWAIETANDDKHGYSNEKRYGNPDYDCSSFVYYAFTNAGFTFKSIGTTTSMVSDFKAYGFTWIPWKYIGGTEKLLRGDILLNASSKKHTEIYLGDGKIVGAHQSRGNTKPGDQTGTEVSVANFFIQPWDGVLRYNGTYDMSSSYVPESIPDTTYGQVIECTPYDDESGLFTLKSTNKENGKTKTISKKLIAYQVISKKIFYVEYKGNYNEEDLGINSRDCYIKVRRCNIKGKKKKTILKDARISGQITGISGEGIKYMDYDPETNTTNEITIDY
ncbi:MAG: C40 family peptidase [Lachnospiraceae bacterium]|nr:C40 family peptidase [Lachnospiraceae bacterium]